VAYGIRTANTSSNGWGIQEECTHTLDCAQGVAVAQPIAFHPTQDPISSSDGSTHALGCGSTGGQASVTVAVALRGREGGGGDKPHVLTAMQVRRLTPRECERLMGFPDDYTLIPWRGKPADQCPDGPRYKALGNSWAVPVVRWIGERINAAVELASK
jgi:DNA (cytosine-5)-methyltransferase 1